MKVTLTYQHPMPGFTVRAMTFGVHQLENERASLKVQYRVLRLIPAMNVQK